MGIGNPKKFKSFDALQKELNVKESIDKEADSTRLYKNKGSRIEKELSFKIESNKSKLT